MIVALLLAIIGLVAWNWTKISWLFWMAILLGLIYALWLWMWHHLALSIAIGMIIYYSYKKLQDFLLNRK